MVTKAKKALLASLAAFLCVMLTVFGLSMSASTAKIAKADETAIVVNETNYNGLAVAFNNADPVNGVITYEIYGKHEIGKTGWIEILKSGLTDVTKVEFVGKNATAEISLTGGLAILADQQYDIDVSFKNLTLSKLNPTHGDDYGHSTNYFTTWLRNKGASENTVTYTNCTFPNGVCNNQYGKTVFTNCEYTNATTGLYNMWVYGGEVEIVGGKFTGTRGAKVYTEGTTTTAPTVTVSGTSFEGLNEKAAIVVSKAATVELDKVTTTGCAKGTLQKDIGTGVTITANGTGISGSFNIVANTDAATVKNELNITGGAFSGEVPADYCADNVKVKQNADGSYRVGSDEVKSVAKVGDTEYNTLADAFAALSSENYTLTLLDESVWYTAKPVYWKAGTQSGYVAKLTDALTAAYKANAGDIVIVCRPGADVGTMTHGHVADNLTIYGNNAYISGGECDLEVDTYKFSRTTGTQANDGAYLEKNITINAYELDNLSVWGQRNTAYTVNVNLTDCDGKEIAGNNVQRVYISGTAGVNNFTITGCDFLTKATSIYSNADGEIVVSNCTFTGAQAPLNINHKADGAVTLEVTNSTFTSCGDNGDWAQYAAPARFVNSGSGTMTVTANTLTFSGTVGSNGDILLGDGRKNQKSNEVTLKVTNTAANIQAQKPGYYNDDGTTNETKVGKETITSSSTVYTTSIEDLAPEKGSEKNPYTLEELGAMTRAEYIAAQEKLGGTMYVTVGNYSYDKNGVLGNGVRNDTPGQVPDHSKLNAYGENGYLGENNDGANGKNIVFVGGSITSGATGYKSIDNIGTSLLLAVPAYTNVTFKGTTFNNVMSFDYQLYTSPWSQLGELKFDGCTFNGLIVGAIASQTLTFNGCTFTNYTNTDSANNSNPTWIRPAYGNWTQGDNEGQGDDFKSLTTINFTGNNVTSTRPVKFERIAQWEMATTVTAANNEFTISAQDGDTSTKNVGLYLGANAKFGLKVENNTKLGSTAALYTAVYSAPSGASYAGLPAGSTVTDTKGNGVTVEDAYEWKTTTKLTLETTKEVAEVNGVKFATLAEAVNAVSDGGEIVVYSGVYTIPNVTYTGKSFTISAGVGQTVSFDMSVAHAIPGAKVSFNNVTFDYKTNGNYIGLQHADTLTYNGCTINGMVFLYATNETFNGCTFNQDSKDAYNVWTYGAKNVAFNRCVFKSAGKSVLVYNEGANPKTDLTVSETEFVASEKVDGKAAIEIDTSLMAGTTITIDDKTTATNFAAGSNSGNTLWNDKKQTADTNKNTIITVADEVVFAPYVVAIGEVKYFSLTAAFEAARVGTSKVVTLLADYTATEKGGNNPGVVYDITGVTFDLGGHKFSASNFAVVFAGSNGVIQNGEMICLNGSYALFIGDEIETKGFTASNLTLTGGINVYNATMVVLDNLTVNGTNYYAVWADENASITIESGTYTAGDVALLSGAAVDLSTINVTGGTFITNDKPLMGNSKGTLQISGGTFSSEVKKDYLANGFRLTKTGESYGVTAKYIESTHVSLGTALSFSYKLRVLNEGETIKNAKALYRTVRGNLVEINMTLDNNGYYVFDGITPQMLDRKISVNVYIGDTVVYDVVDYSILDYLQDLLKTDLGTKATVTKQLVADLAFYGKAAMKYVGYTTAVVDEFIANNGLTQSTGEMTGVAISSGTEKVANVSVQFASQNKILIGVAESVINDHSYTIKVNGTEIDKALWQTDVVDGYRVYVSDGFAASHITDENHYVEVEVLKNGASVQKVRCNIAGYCMKMAENAKMSELAKATYYYGVSAAEYANFKG